MLELYNIRKYFMTEKRVDLWSEEQYAAYKEKAQLIPGILGKYTSTLSDANLIVQYQGVSLKYSDDFWNLFCDNKVYGRIEASTIERLLNKNESAVWHMLEHKILVSKYGQEIANHLLKNQYTVEKLSSYYLAASIQKKCKLYVPAEFTQAMQDTLIENYIEREQENINILQLLENAQGTNEFMVSDKLRLKARKKRKALQEKFFSESGALSFDVEISFQSIPNTYIIENHSNQSFSYIYSREWIQENQDFPTLLNNFIYLFGYVDNCYRTTFVSLKRDMGILESLVGIRGKKEYPQSMTFIVKKMCSSQQMMAYYQELKRQNIQLENIFKWFFENYLADEFGVSGFTYYPPSEGTTYNEKCKLLAIAIDGALKQYRIYYSEGHIDRELLEISSGHVIFGELLSRIPKKYVYSNSQDIEQEMFLLFSNQSMLTYNENAEKQYETLPQLLMNEDVLIKDFLDFQQKNLYWLIARNVLYIDENGYLRCDKIRTAILKDLYENEVICPRYYPLEWQKHVDLLIELGELCYANTMFSKLEQAYLNYILNKAEFSNGLDLRNRYAHDTCSLDATEQFKDYMELLKIMVLIIIKINEEFCVQQL